MKARIDLRVLLSFCDAFKGSPWISVTYRCDQLFALGSAVATYIFYNSRVLKLLLIFTAV